MAYLLLVGCPSPHVFPPLLDITNLCLLIFAQGAARKLVTQRKNIEVVESVGIAGKADLDRKVKYFRLEVRILFPFFAT